MTALHLITPAPAADLPALIAWRDAEPGRECRIFTRTSVPSGQRAWWVELFNLDTCLASVGHADPQIAISRALQMAAEER